MRNSLQDATREREEENKRGDRERYFGTKKKEN